MSDLLLPLPGDRWAVPGNRWDLVPARERRPFVSVIVPYYQDRAQLGLMLEGLAQQDCPDDSYEIIVVDDGSPEPLALPAVLAGTAVPVRVLRQEDRGFRAAAARNLGAAAAGGEVLCFLDQDTVPEPAYLRHLVRLPAVLPDALVVGRRRHADLTGWRPEQVRAWLGRQGPAPAEFDPPAWLADAYRDQADLLRSDDTSYRFVISAVMACGVGLFQELGGFDESFTSYGGEDWELAFRAYNAGAVLAHEPLAVAWHDGPDWAGRGDAESRRRTQAEERRALARLLPDRVRVGGAPKQDGSGPADLVLHWTNTAEVGTGALDRAVRALLASGPDRVLYLDPGQTRRCAPAPDRVFEGAVPKDVLDRALDLVTLDGDCHPQPDDLVQAHQRLRSGTTGRVRVYRPGSTAGPVLTGHTVRAMRRAARWQLFAPQTDLLEQFFGSTDLSVPGHRPA